MRRYDLKKTNGEIRRKLSEDDIRELFGLREVTATTPCRISGTQEWHVVNDDLPLMKYEAVSSWSASTGLANERSTSSLDRDDRGRPARTTALTAGWICFGLGAAVAWLFPPAHFFYSVAVILAIVCMCTHQVARGKILLISCLRCDWRFSLIFFGMAVGAVATAAVPALGRMNQGLKEVQMRQQSQQSALRDSVQKVRSNVSDTPSISLHPTPARSIPIEHLGTKDLLEEISRLEELQRASRKAGREVPAGTLEKLLRVQAAYDAQSRRHSGMQSR